MSTTPETRLALSTALAPSETGSRRFYVANLRWWICALLMGVTVVNYLDRTCLAVAAPTLKQELGIDALAFSRIVMAFQLAYLLMQPVAGRMLDTLNLRRGLALSIGWWSSAQMLTAVATGWPGFAAFRALLGVGEAANFPGAAKAVAQWFRPAERSIAMGILNMGAGFGAILAPPIVAYMILRHGWQWAFVATGAVGLVWVIVWVVAYRAPEDHPRLSPAELGHILAGRDEATPPKPPIAEGGWRATIADRRFWGLALARFLSEPAWQFFVYWIPLYLATERHLRLQEIAWFSWVPFVAGDVGCVAGGFLSPAFMRLGAPVLTARKLAASCAAAVMIFAVFIGSAPSVSWAIFFFCLAAFAHQAMSSTLLTLPADLFPPELVATASGLAGMIGGIGGMLFTLTIGLVVARVGYAPLFIAIAFFDVVGATLLWSLVRERATPWVDAPRRRSI